MLAQGPVSQRGSWQGRWGKCPYGVVGDVNRVRAVRRAATTIHEARTDGRYPRSQGWRGRPGVRLRAEPPVLGSVTASKPAGANPLARSGDADGQGDMPPRPL